MRAFCRVVFVVLVTAAFVIVSSASRARTSDYPSKLVRILVGAPAGGTTDTMARAVANELAPALGQPVIVENKPGAGGNIAADAVAKAPADGHTLLVSFTSHTINATLYQNLPFDPVAD